MTKTKILSGKYLISTGNWSLVYFQFVFNIRDKVLTSVFISRNESSCSENEEKNAGTGNEKSADDKSNMADDVNPEKKSNNQIVLSNRHKSLGIIRIR